MLKVIITILLCVGLRIQLMYGYFVDLRTCGRYFADRRPQLGPQNTHWLVRRSASPQNTRGLRAQATKVTRGESYSPWNFHHLELVHPFPTWVTMLNFIAVG